MMIETRERLLAWLNDPEEPDGEYIDTLNPLVRKMLQEQIDEELAKSSKNSIIEAATRTAKELTAWPALGISWWAVVGTAFFLFITSLVFYIYAIYDPSGGR